MRKIFIHLIACSVALVFTVRVAHATNCNLSIPTPPNPVPSGFDWTPLAQNFCAQLAACGYSAPSCVSDYLSGVAGFPAPPGSGVEAYDTASTTDTLVCEDSDEYALGETTCCAPSCSGKACGADDGCGHSCCLQCTSCAPVSCGQCWVADACGATCTPAPNGSPCGFGSNGGFCQSGTCTTTPDASVPDARIIDASFPDARIIDASGPDARIIDASFPDGPSSGSDASVCCDAGPGPGSDASLPHLDASVLDARGSAFPSRH
jgi:hypothetical protein